MKFKKLIKRSVVLVSIILVSPIVFVSCETDIVTEEYPDFSAVTEEAVFLKDKFRAQLPIIKALALAEENQLKSTKAGTQSNEELSVLLSELSSESLCMLESYGVSYADIEQYVDGIDDPRIAVIGMVFISLQEKGIPENSVRLKSSSTEGGEFSYGQVMDCLGRTFLGVSLADAAFGTATSFTMTTALGIAGRVASRTLGVVGAAIAVADFGDCMGWYDIW